MSMTETTYNPRQESTEPSITLLLFVGILTGNVIALELGFSILANTQQAIIAAFTTTVLIQFVF